MRYATLGGRWHLPTPVKKSDPLILRGNSCCLPAFGRQAVGSRRLANRLLPHAQALRVLARL